MKTPFQRWLKENVIDLHDMWASMGTVEKHEEGGTFKAFCEKQFGQRDIDCQDCGEPCETEMERAYECCSTHLEGYIYSLKN
jgi:hypothetical protein